MRFGRPLSVARSSPVIRLVVLFVLLSVVPLGLLTYLSSRFAGEAVRDEVRARMSSTASITARLVEEELRGLADLTESYADRPNLHEALRPTDGRQNLERVRFHLHELKRARKGIYTTFVAEPNGRLIDIVPATPEIIGKDFSFRDWYRGVTRTGAPYVSEVYETQARGTPFVVAAATPIEHERTGETIGILVAAYSVDHIQEFSDQLAGAQDVKLKVTDQRGILVAASGDRPRELVSRRADPRVAAALEGESGLTELDTPDGRRLSGYTPVRTFGWTVTASVPANAAFAAVGRVRSTLIGIAAILGMLLLGGLVVLFRLVRESERLRQGLAAQNERLVELDRLKDSFVASVSHEFRTPLTSIRGYLELVLDGEAGDLTDEQRHFLSIVDRSSDRLLRLVGDLLFVAQVEAGRIALDRERVDVAAVVREGAEAAKPAAQAKDIELVVEADGVPPISADRARLAQLLDNLVSNAIKFTPEGGRVEVRAYAPNGTAVLEVRDTGLGIPREEQAHVFERFYRAKAASEQAIQGTGLGLSITKAIAVAHGGSVSLESEQGRGATFRVELPLSEDGETDHRMKEAAL